MTKNSKAMRRVLCGVVSFLLSFFSCLFVMCLVFKFTVLSPSFLVGVEKRSDYAEALHSELKEQFVSYGSAGNVDESFFDSVFENIITPDRIDEDTKAVITDFITARSRTRLIPPIYKASLKRDSWNTPPKRALRWTASSKTI